MTNLKEAFIRLLTPPQRSANPLEVVQQGEDNERKIAEIIAHFSADGYELPISSTEHGAVPSAETSPLSEREMMFLSREGIIRYLTATKGDEEAAVARLEKTLIWRRTENVEDLQAMSDSCEPEAKTGKNIVLGYTPQGRPIIYFFPNRNTTPVERRRAIHAIFMLERASDLMCHGVTDTVVIFSFIGKRSGQPTSISVARETLHILSEYYPEKLHTSHFLAMPWIVKTFVNLMWPFVDTNTKRKVKFEADIIKDGDVAAEDLLKECGGNLEMPYDHDAYWPTMIEICRDRREDQLKRWRALGDARVGREERLFKVAPGAGSSLDA